MCSFNEKNKAIVMMCICASLWSIAGIFIKWISWNPLLIAGARSFIAAIVLMVFMFATKRRFRISKYAIFAGIGLCGSCILFVTANKLTTAANAIVLQFTAPVFILIFSALLFREKFHKRDVTVVVLTMAGIALFFFDQLSPGSLLGNVLGIGSGLFLATMYVAVGRAAGDDSVRMSGILLAHLFTAAIGLPTAAIVPTSIDSVEILCILVLGVLQLGVPYVLYGVASKHCPPLACSLIGALEPLLNPVWVFLFAGEAPGIFALLGGVIVIASISVWCAFNARESTAIAEHRDEVEKKEE